MFFGSNDFVLSLYHIYDLEKAIKKYFNNSAYYLCSFSLWTMNVSPVWPPSTTWPTYVKGTAMCQTLFLTSLSQAKPGEQ